MADASLKTTLTVGEALILATICFGLFIGFSVEAIFKGFPEARFNDVGVGWMIFLEALLGAFALLFLRSRRFDIGSLYPAPTVRGTFVGVGLFLAAWLVGALAMAAFATPERTQMTTFSYGGLSLSWNVALAMVNGTYEEVFLLGVIARGLRGFGFSIAVGASLLVRVLYHLYQGPLGMVWVLGVGATLTLGYIVSRSLWPPVFAHMLWDIVPVFLVQESL